MKNRAWIVLLMLACLVTFAGCGKNEPEVDLSDRLEENVKNARDQAITMEETAPAPAEDPKEEPADEPMKEADVDEAVDLTKILQNESGLTGEIMAFDQEDFDGDGTEEAFAITGEAIEEYPEQKVVEGTLWFVTGDGCTKLGDSAGMGVYDRIRTMTMGKTKYALFDEVYATALVTYVWYVSDKKAVEAPFSGLGEVLTDTPDGEGRFRIMDDSYDCMFNPETSIWMGHTWKHYYFFYNDETDRVEEYAGTEVQREDVIALCGRDLVGELLPARDQLSSLFCRGNGLIVMNYEHVADGCAMNYHYIYDFLHGYFVDDTGEETGEEPLDGNCREALCPEIANYPELPLPY